MERVFAYLTDKCVHPLFLSGLSQKFLHDRMLGVELLLTLFVSKTFVTDHSGVGWALPTNTSIGMLGGLSPPYMLKHFDYAIHLDGYLSGANVKGHCPCISATDIMGPQ